MYLFNFCRGLADMNSDGKMDNLEFSIAMFLIQKKLQGFEIPKVLPTSLKVNPSSPSASGGFGRSTIAGVPQPAGKFSFPLAVWFQYI